MTLTSSLLPGEIGALLRREGLYSSHATTWPFVQATRAQIIGAPHRHDPARGVCMRGNRVVVVGERQPLSTHTGLVLLSDDGGQTFANVAPSTVKASVYRCAIGPDGEVVVAGADGFIGILSGDRIFTSGFESP